MELQEVELMLKRYIMELKCELTGWDKHVPIETLQKWIKKVDKFIIKPLGAKNDKHDGRS